MEELVCMVSSGLRASHQVAGYDTAILQLRGEVLVLSEATFGDMCCASRAQRTRHRLGGATKNTSCPPLQVVL